MNKHDAPKFAEYMSMLNEMYGDGAKTISDLKMGIYFEALKELSIQDVHDAIAKLARTKMIKAFPTPAEILGAVRATVEDRAELAFQDLIGTIERHGYYDSVIFEDGTIGKCVEAMGGWDKVSEWVVDERKWNRMEFVKLYKIYEARGPWPAMKFAGFFEQDNSIKGFLDHIPEPIRIGKGTLELVQGKKAIGGQN